MPRLDVLIQLFELRQLLNSAMTSKPLIQALFRCKPLVIFGRPRPTLRPFSSTPQSLALSSSNFDPLGAIEEKPWEFDDISSAGHAELDQHREAREYARIAAYEMPLLARMHFVNPSESCG